MRMAILPALSLLASLPTHAAPPPGLQIEKRQSNDIALTATDRQNGSWILQSSTDLKTWTNTGPQFHIRNSLLPLPDQTATATARYFRLVPGQSAPLRTLDHMLDLPGAPYNYAAAAAAPATIPRAPAVAIDNNKALLGRVLFHDRRLSHDNSISCSSCHQQKHGFADNRRFSTGHIGVPTTRNSQSLLHVRVYQGSKQLFWDGHVAGLRNAVVAPIGHPDEMGTSLGEVVLKIQNEPYYQELTQRAYGSPYVTPAYIAECLEDFMESIPSFNSRWDIGSKTSFQNFTPEEHLGRITFGSHCNTCHSAGAFSNGAFMNNGLDLVSADPGLGGVTKNSSDIGKFRVPSLRDVAATAPYMHDGRFNTLREVIDHYSNGTQPHPNRHASVASPMNFTEQQKQALEAFLHTLTDEASATNDAFSDPFRYDVP